MSCSTTPVQLLSIWPMCCGRQQPELTSMTGAVSRRCSALLRTCLQASQSLLRAQGNGTLMTGMFQCAAGGWCGWGFPRAAGEMIGASALIMRNCAACASGAQPDLAPPDPTRRATVHAQGCCSARGLVSILEICAEAWTACQLQDLMAVSMPVSAGIMYRPLPFLSAPCCP